MVMMMSLSFMSENFGTIPTTICLLLCLSAIVAALCAKKHSQKEASSHHQKHNSPRSSSSSSSSPFGSPKKIMKNFPKVMCMRGTQDDEESRNSNDNGEEWLWKKSIWMGEKCEPLQFSGAIHYDSEGNQLPQAPSRSPRPITVTKEGN